MTCEIFPLVLSVAFDHIQGTSMKTPTENGIKKKLSTRPHLTKAKAVLACCLMASLIACIELDNNSNDNADIEKKAHVQLKENASQSEFKQFLTAQYTQKYSPATVDDTAYLESIAVDSATADSNAGNSNEAEFSGTNTQVAGVDEGDIWKYDGENFFVLRPAVWNYNYGESYNCDSSEPLAASPVAAQDELIDYLPCSGTPTLVSPAQVRIVKNTQETLSTVDLNEINPNQLYLKDNSLVILGNRTSYQDNWISSQNWQDGQTNLSILNIQSKTEPEIKYTVSIDGFAVESRRIGDEIFLISRYSPSITGLVAYPETQAEIEANQRIINDLSLSSLLPKIVINDQQQNLITDQSCLIPNVSNPLMGSTNLTMITRININDAQFSSRCMAGEVQGIYMSSNNLYTFNTSYWDFSDTQTSSLRWNEGNTHLHKFDLATFNYQGSALVEGQLASSNPRLRLGELNDGSIALVTSKIPDEGGWRLTQHQLTILNSQGDELKVISSLPNTEQSAAIGKVGEQIYSVRFMQDRAYIVTFQKVDPLYVIDLSNTSQPTIAGELEIPGFSDYLHPIGNDLLLGIGKDAILGQSGTTWYQGIKVSLFDVANIQQPAELGTVLIGKRGSSTPLSYDPLSFAGIQQDEQYRFAFPIKVNNGPAQGNHWGDPDSQFYQWSQSGLFLFEVKNKQLIQAGALITESSEDNDANRYHNINSSRGLIQGDDAYHLSENDIYKADWNSPEDMSGKF